MFNLNIILFSLFKKDIYHILFLIIKNFDLQKLRNSFIVDI